MEVTDIQATIILSDFIEIPRSLRYTKEAKRLRNGSVFFFYPPLEYGRTNVLSRRE